MAKPNIQMGAWNWPTPFCLRHTPPIALAGLSFEGGSSTDPHLGWLGLLPNLSNPHHFALCSDTPYLFRSRIMAVRPMTSLLNVMGTHF